MKFSKSPQKIQKMFDSIAQKYDFLNNIISFGMHKKIKYLMTKQLNVRPEDKIIDLCCGTGDIAIFLKEQNPNVDITAVDFSDEMLKIAQSKSKNNIKFVKADCTNLPFEDEIFDLCTISFGLRNIENRQKALNEIHRILKKDGVFVHLDFGKSNLFLDSIFDSVIPFLVRVFYQNAIPYDYLVESKKEFPSSEKLIKEFEKNGFKFKERHNFLFGVISSQIMQKIKE